MIKYYMCCELYRNFKILFYNKGNTCLKYLYFEGILLVLCA